MNTRLRAEFARVCEREGIELLVSAPALCTDNAAMIAAVAALALEAGEATPVSEDINPNLALAFAEGDAPVGFAGTLLMPPPGRSGLRRPFTSSPSSE